LDLCLTLVCVIDDNGSNVISGFIVMTTVDIVTREFKLIIKYLYRVVYLVIHV